MPEGDVPLSRLLSLLPQGEEAEEVRLAVLAAAGPSEGGGRAVPREAARDAIAAAAGPLEARVDALFRGYGDLFAALWAGDRAGAVAVLLRLGDEELGRHQLARARAFHEAALRAAQPLGDAALHAAIVLRLARAAAAAGDVAHLLQHASRAAELMRNAGDAPGEGAARRLMGDALAAQRRFERAAEAYAMARVKAPDRAAEVTAAEALGRLQAGVVDEAETALAALPAGAAARTDVRRARALLRDRRGLPAAAVADLAAAAADATPAERVDLALDAAAILRASGDLAAAAERADAAEAAAVEAHAPHLLGAVALERARIARAGGEGEAAACLDDALRAARAHGHPLLEARCHEERGALHAAAGRTDEAGAAYARARDLYADMGLDVDAGRVAEAIRLLSGPPAKRGRGRPKKS